LDAIARHARLVGFYNRLGYASRGTDTLLDWRGMEWEIIYLEKVLAGD
jgi:hypothetical protein